VAIVRTFDGRRRIIIELLRLTKQLLAAHTNAKNATNSLWKSGENAADTETLAQEMLDDCDVLATKLSSLWTALSFTYANEVYPRSNHVGSFTSVDVDANNGSDKAVLTADGGTPFSQFQAGDVVAIENAEDPDNNSTSKTVDSASNTVITLTTTLTDDNSDDESLTVVLKER